MFYKTRHTLQKNLECMPFPLPVYDRIYDFTLFSGSFSEINTGGFNAFMSHKISRNAISLQRSRKLFANLCRNEWGYTTDGLILYLTANFFSCPEMPRVVIRSPYLFKKMKPLSCCFSVNQERASFCNSLGI